MIARAPFRFTVERYDAMIDAGILGEDDPVELIRGEIARKMPIGDRHSACLMRLNDHLVQAIGKRAPSLEFDREDKLPIYAEAEIPEYWIVNLIDDVIEVNRNPAGSTYATTTIARRGDSLTLLALPDVAIGVSDVLP